jgi:phage gp29-like protein
MMAEMKNTPETREIAAASIRDRWSGYPSSGLTPRRLASILRAADAGDPLRQMELFSEMEEKDAHLFSCLQTRKLSVSGLDWDVVRKGTGIGGQDVAGFIKDALGGIDNFEEALLDLLDAVGKGYSISEVMWAYRDGSVVPSALKKRQQKRFTFMEKDGVSERPRLLTSGEPVYGVPLVQDKFVVHVYRAGSDLPERGGLLRVLAWIYLFKNYALKDWVSFCEVFGMPLRLGIYSPTASKEDRESLIQAVTQLGSDAAGVISESTRIEFVEAAQKSGAPYKDLVELLNREISKAALGQTLTTDVSEKGSYAAGIVHDGVRGDIMRADARSLERTINRDLVRPLVMFNFGPGVKPPEFKFIFGQ